MEYFRLSRYRPENCYYGGRAQIVSVWEMADLCTEETPKLASSGTGSALALASNLRCYRRTVRSKISLG